jgi:hypothetical protein
MKNIVRIAFLAIAISAATTCAYAQTQVVYDFNSQPVPQATFPTDDNTPYAGNAANSSLSLAQHVPGTPYMAYPNPTVNATRIVLDEPAANNVYVDIINLNGAVVGSYQFAPGSYQLDIDLGNLPMGTYSAQVTSNGIAPQNIRILKH